MTIIRQNYQEQLDELLKDIRRMGLYTYFNINNAIVSLSEKDKNFARQVINKDKDINKLDCEINEKVILLIMKQQPIASDLRMMMAALKIATDFERMGDNVASIANIRLRVKITDDYVLTRLKTMGKLAMLMLQDLNTAAKHEDITLIREIIDRDQDIDDLYANIVNTTYLIDNDPFVAGQAHLAARNLERVGDHVTNIASSGRYGGFLNHDLGIKHADKQMKVNSAGNLISNEYLTKINPDKIFVINRTKKGNDKQLPDELKNDVVKNVKAIKNGQVYQFESNAWYFGEGGNKLTIDQLAKIKQAFK